MGLDVVQLLIQLPQAPHKQTYKPATARCAHQIAAAPMMRMQIPELWNSTPGQQQARRCGSVLTDDPAELQ